MSFSRENLDERARRLTAIVGDLPLTEQSRLVKAVALPPNLVNRLQTAAAIYVWHSLSQAHPDRRYLLSPRVLEDYLGDFLELPNRTPNGLLLPRCETFLSFNLVQQALVFAIRELGLEQAFDAVQSPCNIRVVSGDVDAKADSRPYASSTIHTDVWYGEPLRSILFNLPLLGDTSAAAIEFFELEDFPSEFATALNSFEKGREISSRAARLPMGFDLGVLYVSDSLSLHQTVRRAPGLRLSLDWRALPRERLPSEVSDKILSRATYVTTDRFLEAGSTLVFADGDPIDAFLRRSRGENVERAAIEIVPVGLT